MYYVLLQLVSCLYSAEQDSIHCLSMGDSDSATGQGRSSWWIGESVSIISTSFTYKWCITFTMTKSSYQQLAIKPRNWLYGMHNCTYVPTRHVMEFRVICLFTVYYSQMLSYSYCKNTFLLSLPLSLLSLSLFSPSPLILSRSLSKSARGVLSAVSSRSGSVAKPLLM